MIGAAEDAVVAPPVYDSQAPRVDRDAANQGRFEMVSTDLPTGAAIGAAEEAFLPTHV